jgi:NAD(P)-dependent dehydrogenase (short-subunit alcohol dehydrogenase family)
MNQDKRIVITGGTGAIGKAIALKLAGMNYQIDLIVRNEKKGQDTINEIIRSTGNNNINYHLADLSSYADINALASSWEKPIHVLINDAAVTPRTRQVTKEGIEMQFATNVLGYFWMTSAFKKILTASAPARVVDVSSYWVGGLDLNDLEFKDRNYSNGAAYRQSKQANRMLVSAWAERLIPFNITINACHPGDVNSTLSNNLGFGGYQSPDDGAETPVWLAVSDDVSGITGKYFEHLSERECPYMSDSETAEKLFEICQSYDQ